MAEMTALQLMIVELAKSGISSSALKSAVLSVHPHLNDGAYLGNWPPCKSKAGLLVKRRRALGFSRLSSTTWSLAGYLSAARSSPK